VRPLSIFRSGGGGDAGGEETERTLTATATGVTEPPAFPLIDAIYRIGAGRIEILVGGPGEATGVEICTVIDNALRVNVEPARQCPRSLRPPSAMKPSSTGGGAERQAATEIKATQPSECDGAIAMDAACFG
jgi:hypothetical protein